MSTLALGYGTWQRWGPWVCGASMPQSMAQQLASLEDIEKECFEFKKSHSHKLYVAKGSFGFVIIDFKLFSNNNKQQTFERTKTICLTPLFLVYCKQMQTIYIYFKDKHIPSDTWSLTVGICPGTQ